MNDLKIFETVAENLNNGKDFIIATVVNTSGSAPAKTGFRMIVYPGKTEGTVGGGALENEVVRIARELHEKKGEPKLVRINVGELDMQCGGEVTLFIEPFYSKQKLWIFGGGHIASKLVPIATSIGFSVTVVDSRPEYASKSRFPEASNVLNSPYGEAAKKVPEGSFVVIVTHQHKNDQEVLREVVSLTPPLPYIGMIGSRKKVKQALEDLKSSGKAPGSNIYSPVGLDVGGESPAEIAVSIASELMGVFYKKEKLPHCRNRLE